MRAAVAALATAAAALGAAPPAYAEPGWYAGLTASQIRYQETGFETLTPVTVGFKAGREINRHFAIEGRMGFGAGRDSVPVNGFTVELELDYYFGLYAKGMLPLADRFALYGIAGFTAGTVATHALGFTFTESDYDLSYGAGAEFVLGRKITLGLEWAQLIEGPGYKFEAVTLGLGYRF
jgi:opacity protein-like surface antigen